MLTKQAINNGNEARDTSTLHHDQFMKALLSHQSKKIYYNKNETQFNNNAYIHNTMKI